MYVTVYGIDPGIVHTGVVKLHLDTNNRIGVTSSTVVAGLDAKACADLVAGRNDGVFIEAYRPRSHFSTDKAMVLGVQNIKNAIPSSKVLQNTGVKKIVLPTVMQMFGMNNFPTTNHQDLQSAARILLLGMYKDEKLNALVYEIVSSVFHGANPWVISHA